MVVLSPTIDDFYYRSVLTSKPVLWKEFFFLSSFKDLVFFQSLSFFLKLFTTNFREFESQIPEKDPKSRPLRFFVSPRKGETKKSGHTYHSHFHTRAPGKEKGDTPSYHHCQRSRTKPINKVLHPGRSALLTKSLKEFIEKSRIIVSTEMSMMSTNITPKQKMKTASKLGGNSDGCDGADCEACSGNNPLIPCRTTMTKYARPSFIRRNPSLFVNPRDGHIIVALRERTKREEDAMCTA